MNVCSFLALLLFAPAQGPGTVDPKQVDKAIARGIEHLKRAGSPAVQDGSVQVANSDELILWTFVHAGVHPTDPLYQKLLKDVVSAPLERTYKVALQAMVLEEVQRVKHQPRLAQCAQFLVDNQCANGQWSYGEPTSFPDTPTPATATGARPVSEKAPKPKVVRRLTIRKHRDGPASGDNSNSQYAALGLRACHQAGIEVPPETIARAIDAWRKGLMQEGEKAADKSVATGPAADAVGHWEYSGGAGGRVYGMTAGGVGSLSLLLYMSGSGWMKDKSVVAGLNWLGRNFSVTRSDGEHFLHYYYLYGLERAAILYGTKTVGGHDWYAEGARYLLDAQKPDGSWDVGDRSWGPWSPVWDTCFAILFLRRATQPLVASEDNWIPRNAGSPK